MPNSPFNSAIVVSASKIVAVLVYYEGEFRNVREMCLPDLKFAPSNMTIDHCLKTSIKILATAQTDRQAGRQAGRQADRQTDRRTDRQTDTHTHTHQNIAILHPTHVEAYDHMIFYFFNRQSKIG
jgi:hypothetical protein